MSKNARKEGNNVAVAIKASKAEFYIADVNCEDNDADVSAAVENARKTLGKFKSAFMVISAGTKQLIAVICVPEELKDKVSAKEWLNASLVYLNGDIQIQEDSTELLAKAIVVMDTPFKFKDTVRTNGFTYLRKNGLLEEDESSEEFIGFDDI